MTQIGQPRVRARRPRRRRRRRCRPALPGAKQPAVLFPLPSTPPRTPLAELQASHPVCCGRALPFQIRRVWRTRTRPSSSSSGLGTRERKYRQTLARQYLVLGRRLRNYLEWLLAEFEGDFLDALALKTYKQLSEAGISSKHYALCRFGRAFNVRRLNRKTCSEECRKLRPKK